MTVKKGAPRGPKKEQAENSLKNTVLWVQLRGMGMQNKEIADAFGVSEGHVSRCINDFHKKQQELFGPEYQAVIDGIVSQGKKPNAVATRNNSEQNVATREGGGVFEPGSLQKLTPSENLLANITLEEGTRIAYAAGIVPAQAVQLVANALRDDTEDPRSSEEKGNDFVKGFALFGGLAWGIFRGYKALDQKTKPNTINNGEEIE